jgi:hypothetical protein
MSILEFLQRTIFWQLMCLHGDPPPRATLPLPLSVLLVAFFASFLAFRAWPRAFFFDGIVNGVPCDYLDPLASRVQNGQDGQ